MSGKERKEAERTPDETHGPEKAAEPAGSEVQCPLCGCRFEPGENPACAYCPKVFRSCGLVMCPNCSHEFPR